MIKLTSCIVFFASVALLPCKAQDTARANATLQSATVYFGYGAELTHQAKARIKAETRQIIISVLATTVDANSIQISLPESVALLSQRYELYTPQVPVIINPKVKIYTDSINRLYKEISRVNNEIDIETVTMEKTGHLIEAVIENNGNKTTTSDEVLKLVNAYNSKIEKAKTNIFRMGNEKNEFNEQIIVFQIKINELNQSKSQPQKSIGRLILQVKCKQIEEIPIEISYFTNNAGFTPIYDVRVNSKTNEIKLVYKAGIFQNTGLDWEQTKLTLSTANPNWSGTTPILNPWYLQIFAPQIYQLQQDAAKNNIPMNSIPGVEKNLSEIIVSGENGYNKKVASDWKNVNPSTLQSYTTLNENQLNTTFEIDLPYDIKSDGEIQSVTIKEEKIAATLKNYAVPKMNHDAFLLAEISDWENLNLLPGIANIIMDDTYLGRTSIDPNISADTMNLSLGKDKRVIINRTRVKEFTTTKRSGNSIIQTFTYEIAVKNNKSTNVDLILKDQYPISQVKEVEVKFEKNEDAVINEELGILTWNLSLKSGESKKVRFTYTVKYPSDKKVANL